MPVWMGAGKQRGEAWEKRVRREDGGKVKSPRCKTGTRRVCRQLDAHSRVYLDRLRTVLTGNLRLTGASGCRMVLRN